MLKARFDVLLNGGSGGDPVDVGVPDQESRSAPQRVPENALLEACMSGTGISRVEVERPGSKEGGMTEVFDLEDATRNKRSAEVKPKRLREDNGVYVLDVLVAPARWKPGDEGFVRQR